MSTFASDLFPPKNTDSSLPDEAEDLAVEKTGSPGGGQEVEWKIVTKTAGITPAAIIVGRLQAAGVPARAWQEGAGQAYGLTVGLLGDGYVLVPQTFLEEAKEILAEEFEEEE
jgi:hypothetical protein